jgi:hypothetical protein
VPIVSEADHAESDRLQNLVVEELATAVGGMLDRGAEPWRLVLALAAISRVLAAQTEDESRLAPVLREIADELAKPVALPPSSR